LCIPRYHSRFNVKKILDTQDNRSDESSIQLFCDSSVSVIELDSTIIDFFGWSDSNDVHPDSLSSRSQKNVSDLSFIDNSEIVSNFLLMFIISNIHITCP
jgi:hypothetical protein